jgi:hypothetical protein
MALILYSHANCMGASSTRYRRYTRTLYPLKQSEGDPGLIDKMANSAESNKVTHASSCCADWPAVADKNTWLEGKLIVGLDYI